MPGGTRDGSAPAVLVRAPNHLGDLVMALPALEAAGPVDVQVASWLAPLVALVREGERERLGRSGIGRVLPLQRGPRGWWRAVRELRRGRYGRGVLLTPSFSSAVLLAAGGVGERWGGSSDRRGALLTRAMPHGYPPEVHRTSSYLHLVTGELPTAAPAPRLHLPRRVRERWREGHGRALGSAAGPLVGLCPGSNASSRRWDPERFAQLAEHLQRRGARVVVFGGPAEAQLTRRVAGAAAVDLGGRTDLELLAAGLADCSLVIANDSGPLHLAAAVGTPTLSLWGAGNPLRTGVVGAEHQMLRRPDLPCVPCVKNECPRRGAGYYLPDARRECLALIEVAEVEVAAVRRIERLNP